MKCISIGVLIVATIVIIIVGAVAGIWVPYTGAFTGLAFVALSLWWLAGLFLECDEEYTLTGVKKH